jgi:hypothetical protein
MKKSYIIKEDKRLSVFIKQINSVFDELELIKTYEDIVQVNWIDKKGVKIFERNDWGKLWVYGCDVYNSLDSVSKILQYSKQEFHNLLLDFLNDKYKVEFKTRPLKEISSEYCERVWQVNEQSSRINDIMGNNPYKERKQNFIDSIKTFDDLTDENIKELIDYFGYEGFNDEEDGYEDISEKIESYKKMEDPVILYRIVGIQGKKMINTNELGEHWTPYKWNLDSDMLMSIGYELWDSDIKPYVVEALVPHSEIDVLQTLVQNLSFPNEHEINIKNNGKGVKYVKSYKLKL